MPVPVENASFYRVPEAQFLHDVGLKAEGKGDYDRAFEYLGTAQGILAAQPKSMDADVQSARIMRDTGFTFVRRAIARASLADLDHADEILDEAFDKTYFHVVDTGNTRSHAKLPLGLSSKQHKELHSEHGATLGLIGRSVTVREVVFDNSKDTNSPEELYDTADSHLNEGNGYYWASNAMVAARQERIHGRSMLHWLNRADTAWGWTAQHDPRKLVAVTRTIGSRSRDLLDPQVAVQSVTTRP